MDPLSALLIEAECSRLTIRYGHCIDAYDDEGVVALFAEDAVWNHATHGPLRGHAEIRRFLAGRDRSTLMRHVMSNFEIEILDASRARGLSYWTGYVAHNHTPGTEASARPPFSVGEYRDDYVLVDGRWRIASRTMRHVFRDG